MRLLHTADWHLGADLKHVPRLDDQLARVAEVLAICDAHAVDVLLVAGDFIDETRPEGLDRILKRLGAMLRPRLQRGMECVILAGNHDREWIFPLLSTAGDLFSEEVARLHLVWQPKLIVLTSVKGERVRLLCLPYPRQRGYGLEAIVFKDAADRHKQMADAVKQRISTFVAEIKNDRDKIPTVVLAHLLIAGQKENGHELTEEADVPIPRVYLPNYAYVALGHVHKPTQIGSATCRYSGSIERMNFGEAGESKQVVMVELNKTGLVGDPEVVELHPVELRSLEWSEGSDMVALARDIPATTICKLVLNVPVGTNVQALQAQARDLIARLCYPPEINWQGGDSQSQLMAGSLALDRADWRGAVRKYVGEQVADDDPLRVPLLAAVEELLTEEHL